MTTTSFLIRSANNQNIALKCVIVLLIFNNNINQISENLWHSYNSQFNENRTWLYLSSTEMHSKTLVNDKFGTIRCRVTGGIVDSNTLMSATAADLSEHCGSESNKLDNFSVLSSIYWPLATNL